jgi:ADP-ribosylglycohydrolase
VRSDLGFLPWKTGVRWLRVGDADRATGLGLSGAELGEAAWISAVITHAHPNALEAAIAGAWLVRAILERGCLDAALVQEAIVALEGPWRQGGTVAASLRAALEWAGRGEDWLDEDGIPPGDGGWRAGSALGLAVAAALRWPRDLRHAVERAARIRGDSDSVAALTGALLGAALGTTAIPSDWLDTLPERARLTVLVERLLGINP